MKYNGYIVRLKQRENTFTGTLVAGEKGIPTNFKKIGIDLFIANFKSQAQFTFREMVALKTRNKEVEVLLPVISKYNKRKLTRISKFLGQHILESRDPKCLIPELLTVEKFLKVRELLDFFCIDPEEMTGYLLEAEVREKIKIIDFCNFFITSHENYLHYIEELNALFTDLYTSRIKSIKFSEIEEKIKLPLVSIFFKYLLRSLPVADNFPYTVLKDKIVFRKVDMSEDERTVLVDIRDYLKKHKITVFSLDIISGSTDFSDKFREVNNTLWHLVENGDVVQLNERFFIFSEDLNKILNKLKKFKRNEGETIDIQSFRELTLLSRKYIIILFEYFDIERITERLNNHRKILLSV